MEERTESRGLAITRAVFDPNVLISARISSKGAPRELLHHWIASDFEMVASPEVLFELQEVFIRPKFRRYLTYADALEYVLWIHDRADVVEELPTDAVQGVTADPDDDYLPGVVAFGGAEVLVSGDPHLLDLQTIQDDEDRRIARVLTPRQFLYSLRV